MSVAAYEAELARARAAAARGDWTEAVARYGRAAEAARRAGRDDLAERALCIRHGIQAEAGDAAAQIAPLARILLASPYPANRALAGFYAAQAAYLEDDLGRCRRLAHRALEQAELAGDGEVVGALENLLGNVALLRSEFGEARRRFLAAMRRLPRREAHERLMVAQVEDNLGYTMMCDGDPVAGIAHCENALAVMRTFERPPYLPQALQDLCFGELLVERPEAAEERGHEALELALERGDDDIVKNCLFLLAEAAKRRGELSRARWYLAQLNGFYPEAPDPDALLELLVRADLLEVVNLRG